MSRQAKRRFRFERRAGSEKARPLTVSMYPEHEEILKDREREFNVSKSALVGLLLVFDKREGVLRKELARHLRTPVWATTKERTV